MHVLYHSKFCNFDGIGALEMEVFKIRDIKIYKFNQLISIEYIPWSKGIPKPPQAGWGLWRKK